MIVGTRRLKLFGQLVVLLSSYVACFSWQKIPAVEFRLRGKRDASSSLVSLFSNTELSDSQEEFVVQSIENDLRKLDKRAALQNGADARVPRLPVHLTVNGWTPDPFKFCYGLPGNIAPLGNFDPLGVTKDLSVHEIKRYREAEVTHGRVAMLATVGYLVGESFHPLFGGQVLGPANTHLSQVQEIAPPFFTLLAILIGAVELLRALIGWESPSKVLEENQRKQHKAGNYYALLKEDYYPGDIGFDPLKLKPKDATDFSIIQTKELQNGRLAMIAVAGMCAQELVNGETIIGNMKNMFYAW
mmetsp:Transcript_15224/g.22487  ORF Transcript_15224/g.22487 Transcript_15224/m.22487 type:complete len:301 (-) Transcript_15224:189-1091(-)|eukprot:CAMPEP_0116033820 /NCGR_PEP_ID=MMETSP0321-20121206/19225_1 /TAXON_ID=163516 /ORGANISM="Leptocylindrus danicus var. danicus, Strain B650" /LENGTH=300 /DNA_ID=CAMNT_0003509985 /DNA_START=276 /DNA_END=1178 /DNA_ORIENTATION=-